uniref:ARAD1D11616p n=1 Tax=Blastobotrys adeninivorans TaxID=409370 RepID=A0A060T9G2_BLAAD
MPGDYKLKTTRKDIDRAYSCCQSCSTVIRALEEELETAARAGQDLLSKYTESNLAFAKERAQLKMDIDDLHSQIQQITDHSRQLMESNDGLLQRSAQISEALRQSESKIEYLSTELSETQHRLAKMNMYVFQTVHLESQVALLETERHQLELELGSVHQDKSEANRRWKSTERALDKLSTQYEHLETIASEDQSSPNHKRHNTNNTHSSTNHHIKPSSDQLEAENASLRQALSQLQSQLNWYKYETTQLKRDVDFMATDPVSTDANGDSIVMDTDGSVISDDNDTFSHDHDHCSDPNQCPCNYPKLNLSDWSVHDYSRESSYTQFDEQEETTFDFNPSVVASSPVASSSPLDMLASTPIAASKVPGGFAPHTPAVATPVAASTTAHDISLPDLSFANTSGTPSHDNSALLTPKPSQAILRSLSPTTSIGSDFKPDTSFATTTSAAVCKDKFAPQKIVSPVRAKTSMALLTEVSRQPNPKPKKESPGWAARIFSRLRVDTDDDQDQEVMADSLRDALECDLR